MSLTTELQRDEKSIIFVSLHPGNVYTDVTRNYPFWLRHAYTICQPLFRFVQPSLSDGASTSVFAVATPEGDHLRGAYLERSSIAKPAAAALDPDSARRLLQLSEELVAPWGEAL